jgi:probable HAF family extracellular repeat protein
MNEFGDVVGESGAKEGNRVFCYFHGKMHDLGTLRGGESWAFAINGLGQVVGSTETPSGLHHAYVYIAGRIKDLGTLGGRTSCALAINEGGWVVGSAETSHGLTHAFLYRDGKMTDLGTLGGRSSEAFGVDARGEVFGVADTARGGRHVFLYSHGVKRDLGAPTSRNYTITHVSNRREFVGYFVDAYGAQRAFLWSRGKLRVLGSVGRGPSGASWINDHGDVVGGEGWGKGAFLYRHGAKSAIEDLLAPSSRGWEIEEAVAINDRGQIAATATRIKTAKTTGESHAVLLTPIGDARRPRRSKQ